MELIKAFESNPVIATFITILVAIITLYISYKGFVVAYKSFKIAKSTFEISKSNFNIYLEDSFRANFKSDASQKIIFFNIRINNLSSTKNTFTAILEIEYSSGSNQKSLLKVSHQADLIEKINQKKLTVLDNTIRIEEKDIKSGWLLFEQPAVLKNKRINRYKILIKDSHDNQASVESYLIKDIIYEIGI